MKGFNTQLCHSFLLSDPCSNSEVCCDSDLLLYRETLPGIERSCLVGSLLCIFCCQVFGFRKQPGVTVVRLPHLRSDHYGGVYDRSDFEKLFNNDNLRLPSDVYNAKVDSYLPCVLLGDAAFPLDPSNMTSKANLKKLSTIAGCQGLEELRRMLSAFWLPAPEFCAGTLLGVKP